MGHYVLELEPELCGLKIVTQLHHYYRTTCSCGHCTHAKPGTGLVSVVEGRSQDLQQTISSSQLPKRRVLFLS